MNVHVDNFTGLIVTKTGVAIAFVNGMATPVEPGDEAPGAYNENGEHVADPFSLSAKLDTLTAKADAVAKLSKAAVDYREPSERADRRCALCSMYMIPAACSHVAGDISPKGTCDDFARR